MVMPAPVTSPAFINRATVASISEGEIVLPSKRFTTCCATSNGVSATTAASFALSVFIRVHLWPLFVPQSNRWIHLRRASRRNPASRRRHQHQHQRNTNENYRVSRIHLHDDSGNIVTDDQRTHQAERNPQR